MDMDWLFCILAIVGLTTFVIVGGSCQKARDQVTKECVQTTKKPLECQHLFR